MLVILPKNHHLAKHETIKFEEIVSEPFILLEEVHYSEPLNAFHAAGFEPNIKYTIHDDYAIMTMAEAGLGISILAELMLRRSNYDIVCLSLEPPIYRALAIGYKENQFACCSKVFHRILVDT